MTVSSNSGGQYSGTSGLMHEEPLLFEQAA